MNYTNEWDASRIVFRSETRANEILGRPIESYARSRPIAAINCSSIVRGLDADPRVHLSQSQSAAEVLRVSSSAAHARTTWGHSREIGTHPKVYIRRAPVLLQGTTRHYRDGSFALNPNVTATRLRKTDDRLWTARYSISLPQKWRQGNVRRCNSICVVRNTYNVLNVNVGTLISVCDLKCFILLTKVLLYLKY